MELRAVGEAEGCAINEAVHSDESQGDGDDATQRAPTVTKDGDVRNHAEQRFRRPEEKEEEEEDDCEMIQSRIRLLSY